MRREAHLHGRGFWIRPLVIELALGTMLAALYWWEVVEHGLVRGQVPVGGLVPPLWVLLVQFASHTVLLVWLLAASFIDIDEKIVPDEITVTGTLLGLVLATLVPMSLLPHVSLWPLPPEVGEPLANRAGGPAIGPGGNTFWVEPVTLVPQPLPEWLQPRRWSSLAVALGCYWLWCFALVPRIWRGRRGTVFALCLIGRRVSREFLRPPMCWLLAVGTLGITAWWLKGNPYWTGLVTSLAGLVGSGGIVWAVRLMGTLALRREAMGFGDVTLMMMVGTFLGWQACLVAFFLAPLAGVAIGLLQLVFRRDDVLPYVPYLCLGSATVVVAWAPIWVWAQPLFAYPQLVVSVLAVCLLLLGVLLFVWRMVKTVLFGRGS